MPSTVDPKIKPVGIESRAPVEKSPVEYYIPVMIEPAQKNEIDSDLKHFTGVVKDIQTICLSECCDTCKNWTSTFVRLLEEGDLQKIHNFSSNSLPRQ